MRPAGVADAGGIAGNGSLGERRGSGVAAGVGGNEPLDTRVAGKAPDVRAASAARAAAARPSR
ncbi:MAG: hypothetical protein DIU60_024160, partial [Actinomycetes bacterium]